MSLVRWVDSTVLTFRQTYYRWLPRSAGRRTKHSQGGYPPRMHHFLPKHRLWSRDLHPHRRLQVVGDRGLYRHLPVVCDREYPLAMQSSGCMRTPRHLVSHSSHSVCPSAHLGTIAPATQNGPLKSPIVRDDQQPSGPPIPPSHVPVRGIKRTSSGVRKSTQQPLSLISF